MATIRLNNLVNPKQVLSNNNNNNNDDFVIVSQKSSFTDIHLDIQPKKIIGDGYNQKTSNDILVDNDVDAIKNSIRNIFSTRKGQMILTPEFGSSLDQFLFERVDDFMANIIANTILENLSTYEPRIEVIKIFIAAVPDQNKYDIQLIYRFLNVTTQNIITFSIVSDGQISI